MNKIKKILICSLVLSSNLLESRHLIDSFFDDFDKEFNQIFNSQLPEKNIYEKNDNLVIEMNVAGMKPENINVTIEGRNLKVVGKQDEKKEEKDKEYYVKEMHSGSFELSMNLPVEVESSKILAKVENGKLEIIAPKKGTDVKKIKVNVK